MSIKNSLHQELSSAINRLGFLAGGIQGFEPSVEFASDLKHGDLTTNAAMILAKTLKKNPMHIAEEIVKELRAKNPPAGEAGQQSNIFEKIEVAPPGFINFWISKEFLYDQLNQLNEKITFSNIGQGRVVIVEYSSPNIAKPFTVGHLRSTIIGDAIANLMEAVGFEVKRDNHLGDWGTQFGKQIYAIKTWGNEDEIEKSDRPVKLLVDLYVKFHTEAEKDPQLEKDARAWFKKLEDGDKEARRLWQKCIEWSWKEFDQIYSQLGVRFTENSGRGFGESYFEDKMEPIIKELEQKNLLKESEGAKLVFFEDDKLPPLMIVKQDGATLYSTRDLATDKFRIERYGQDITIINEVGIEQSLYFQQLYELEKMLGWFKDGQRIHIKHGHYRFKDEKMSTRKGNVIWLEDVLEEAKRRAFFIKSKNQETATEIIKSNANINADDRTAKQKIEGIITANDQFSNVNSIAIGALKWNDLKRDSKQDILFDWNDILNMEGNSGPYMQYTYVRTHSLLDKAIEQGVQVSKLTLIPSLEVEESDLLRLLARFENVILNSAERYSPSILCNYLFELAQTFNLFYQKLPILKAEGDSRAVRLALTEATGNVIKKGLDLLGIDAPERM